MTTKSALLKAIRARCLDCCCYQPGEVARCVSQSCPSWPYRHGKDPSPARRRTAENLLSAGEISRKKRQSEK